MDLLSRTNLTICLLTLGCIFCRVISQSYPEEGENTHFYPYGPDVGDTTLPRNDDSSSSEIFLSKAFRFFGQQYSSLWVNTNGLLSMTGPVSQYTPDPFPWSQNRPVIAPFWTDIDTGENIGNSNLYYREDMSTDILQRASNDVREAFGREFALFRASWSFIATWHRVTFFGWSGSNDVAPENTFQVICVSNGMHTFVFYHYGDIVWTTGTASNGDPITGLGGTPAQVGFDASDGVNYYNVEGSRTSEIVNIHGTFSFRIDGSSVSDNGCATNGDVTLTPRSGSFLGGDLVTVTGPCFLSEDEVYLDFLDNADEYDNSMLCEHASEEQVTCILGELKVFGLQQVRLRIIRNTTDTLLSFGTFQVLYNVGVDQINILDTVINGARILTWNPDFFGSMENETLADLIFTRISLNSDMQVQYEDIIIQQNIDLGDSELLISEDEFLLNIMQSQLNMEFYGAPCLVHQVTGQKLYGAIGPALWFKSLQLYAILRLRPDLTPLSPAIAILGRLDQFVASRQEEFDLEEEDVLIRFPSFDLPHADEITLTWVIENEGQLDASIFAPVCNAWLESDMARFGRIVESLQPPVPCFGAQAERDGLFVADRTCWNGAPGCALYHRGQSSSAFNCYSSPAPLSIPETPFTEASQQACYDDAGNLITSLLHGSGYFKSTHPRSDQLPVIHYFADQLPYLGCCKFQTQGSRWCQLFQERRPTDDCSDYIPPRPVQTFGDPHISTLDGHEYTFNGHGQYWLVNSANLKLQGRTHQYVNSSGELVNATVWEGFVMKSADSVVVQVNTHILNYVEILIDGVPISFAALADSSIFFTGGQVTQEFGTTVVTVDFNNGVQIVITENNNLLNFLLFLPQLLKGTTSGLMGTWNDDVEDDLTAGDGTGTIPLNSAAEEIFDFGWTWAVTEETSLFNYTDEASFAYFHRPDFRPTFTFILPDEVVATTVCGDNVQCRYDLSVTGSVEIAASTAIVVQEFNETLEQLVTVPSCSFVEAPRNGWIVSNLFTEGSNISFHCNTHFHLEGPSHIICLEGALWNSDPPVCKSPYENPLQDAKDNQVFLKLHINETYLHDYDDLWSNESQVLMESIIPMFHEVYSDVPLFDNITIFDIRNGSLQLWLNLEATSPLTLDEKLMLLKTLQQVIADNDGLLGDTYNIMAPVSILVDNGLGFWVEVSVLQLCDVYIVSGICQNGGQCNMDSGSPTCSCKADYSGEHCEIELTPESSDDSWIQRNKTLFWVFIGLGILALLVIVITIAVLVKLC